VIRIVVHRASLPPKGIRFFDYKLRDETAGTPWEDVADATELREKLERRGVEKEEIEKAVALAPGGEITVEGKT
jgi:hypothetical protein